MSAVSRMDDEELEDYLRIAINYRNKCRDRLSYAEDAVATAAFEQARRRAEADAT